MTIQRTGLPFQFWWLKSRFEDVFVSTMIGISYSMLKPFFNSKLICSYYCKTFITPRALKNERMRKLQNTSKFPIKQILNIFNIISNQAMHTLICTDVRQYVYMLLKCEKLLMSTPLNIFLILTKKKKKTARNIIYNCEN